MGTTRTAIGVREPDDDPPAEQGKEQELLTTAEVADFLRTSASTVRFWRHSGTGPRGFRTGRKVLYRRSDVDLWVDQRAAAEQDK